jgi:hypothetical protein
LTAFRYKDWFAMTEGSVKSGIQIGFGFVLALIVFILAIMKKTSFLKGIWGWVLALGITFCLRSIINELWLILLAITCAEMVFTVLADPLENAEEQLKIARDTGLQEAVKKDIENEEKHYSGRA